MPYGAGNIKTAVDFEEKLQRVLFKLSCRKGGFAPKKEIGSRLYMLVNEKKENRETAARKYVLEALEEETGVSLTALEVKAVGDTLSVYLTLEYNGESEKLQVDIG